MAAKSTFKITNAKTHAWLQTKEYRQIFAKYLTFRIHRNFLDISNRSQNTWFIQTEAIERSRKLNSINRDYRTFTTRLLPNDRKSSELGKFCKRIVFLNLNEIITVIIK